MPWLPARFARDRDSIERLFEKSQLRMCGARLKKMQPTEGHLSFLAFIGEHDYLEGDLATFGTECPVAILLRTLYYFHTARLSDQCSMYFVRHVCL